jgi:hypothetical protein
MSGRPKLGAVFRGETGPDRTAGLAGLLSVAAPPSTENEVATDTTPTEVAPAVPTDACAEVVVGPQEVIGPIEPPTRVMGERALSLAPAPPENANSQATPEAAAEPASAPRKPKRSPTKAKAAVVEPQADADEDSDTIRMVPANIDVSVHADLRQFATRNELSFATVVLRAIEANAETLSTMWSKPRVASRTGLFGATAAKVGNRRAEPAVQIQLRIPVADAQVLADLVDAWQAPSRGVMVTEALRLFVPSAGPAPRG